MIGLPTHRASAHFTVGERGYPSAADGRRRTADGGRRTADGGRIMVSVADWPAHQRPKPGRRVVLCDVGLSKAAVVRQVREDLPMLVDVVRERVRPIEL